MKELGYVDEWDLSKLKKRQRLLYVIKENNLNESSSGTKEWIFLTYLRAFDLFLQLSDEITGINLKPPYIYFSPYRSSETPMGLQINLGENLYELLAGYFNATSRSNTSLTKIAGLYFGQRKREFEVKATRFGYQKKWENDPQIRMLKEQLKKIKYSWDLKYNLMLKGNYDFHVEKDGKKFQIGQASSGEKEIFNFLLGIIAFVGKGGLFLMDEPELHLHPSWQTLLISFFEELATKTNSQFIISTHSPIFITNKILSNTIRFYKNDDNSSNLIAIPETKIKKTREMLHIVNSQNNEKMFFADKVILVEGITDRLIMKKLLGILIGKSKKSEVIEVLDVGSKDNLQKYRDFLDLIRVTNYIVADQDYIADVGDKDLKKMLVADENSLINNVFKNTRSNDRTTLVEKLEDAIRKKDKDELLTFLRYIKNRHLRIKKNLTVNENKKIEKFLDMKKKEKIYILRKGDIEDYFNIKKHDLDKVMELIKDENFSTNFKANRKKTSELVKIIKDVIGLDEYSVKKLFTIFN